MYYLILYSSECDVPFSLTFMCLFCIENILKLFLPTEFTLKKEMWILNNTGESTDRIPVVA